MLFIIKDIELYGIVKSKETHHNRTATKGMNYIKKQAYCGSLNKLLCFIKGKPT